MTAKEAEESSAQWGRMCARLQKKLGEKRGEVVRSREALEAAAFVISHYRRGWTCCAKEVSKGEALVQTTLATDSGKAEAKVIAAAEKQAALHRTWVTADSVGSDRRDARLKHEAAAIETDKAVERMEVK